MLKQREVAGLYGDQRWNRAVSGRADKAESGGAGGTAFPESAHCRSVSTPPIQQFGKPQTTEGKQSSSCPLKSITVKENILMDSRTYRYGFQSI